MSLGIFVEGPSDKTTIPILVQKAGYRAGIHPRIVPRGDMLDGPEMARHVGALIDIQRGVNRVIVFIDSEGADPTATLRSTNGVSARLNRITGRVPLNYVVVDHSLEGWLACDIDALRSVLGAHARIRIRGNPEDHPRPAELMGRLFRANGRDFKKTVDNPKIAGFVTPQNIAERSPTFRRLLRVLGQRPRL